MSLAPPDTFTTPVTTDHALPVGLEGSTVTVKNLAGDTVYYGDRNVSATANVGSLAVGDSIIVTAPKTWVLSASLSTVSLVSLLSAPSVPGDRLVGGRWYPGWPNTGTAALLIINAVYAIPFLVNTTHIFPAVGLNHTIAGTGGTDRFGVYADNGSAYPGVLVKDYGTVAATGTGVTSITANVTLTPGLYWLVVSGQGGSVQPTVTTVGTINPFAVLGSSAASGSAVEGWTITGVTGALPNPFTAGGAVANALPYVQLQA